MLLNYDPMAQYRDLFAQNKAATIPGSGVVGMLGNQQAAAKEEQWAREAQEIAQYGRVLSPLERFSTTLPVSDSPADVQSTLANVAGGGIAGGVAGRVMDEPLTAIKGILNPQAAPSAVGTMGGVQGATNLMQRHAEYGPMQAIRMAQKMEERGVPRERIWDATAEFFRREDLPYAGVYKGVDGEWRFEIPDTDAKVIKEPGLRYPEPQSDVFQHEALSKAYPETKDVKVVGDIDSYSSEYTLPDKFRMSLLKGEDDLRKGFLHENQHVVQDVENFARGGTVDEFIPSAFELKNAKAEAVAAEYLLNEAKGSSEDLASFMVKHYQGFDKSLDGATSLQEHNHVLDVINGMNYFDLQGLKGADKTAALEKMLKDKKGELSGMRTIRSNTSLANEKYKRLAGEVEARSTERRGNLPLERLREVYPWRTMDRDVEKQIIKRKGILE